MDEMRYRDDDIVITWRESGRVYIVWRRDAETANPGIRLMEVDETEKKVLTYLANAYRYIGPFHYVRISEKLFQSYCKDTPLSTYQHKKTTPWKSVLRKRVRLEMEHFYGVTLQDNVVNLHLPECVNYVIEHMGFSITDLERKKPLVNNEEAANVIKEWGIRRYGTRIMDNLHLLTNSNASYRKRDGAYLIPVPDWMEYTDWRGILKDTSEDITKDPLFATFDGFVGTANHRKMKFDFSKLYHNPELRNLVMKWNGFREHEFDTYPIRVYEPQAQQDDDIFGSRTALDNLGGRSATICTMSQEEFFHLLPLNPLGLWNRCYPPTEELIYNPDTGLWAHPNKAAAFRFAHGYVYHYKGISRMATILTFLIRVCQDKFEITPEETILRVSFFERFYSDFFVESEEALRFAQKTVDAMVANAPRRAQQTVINLENNLEVAEWNFFEYPMETKWENALHLEPSQRISLKQAMNLLKQYAIEAFLLLATQQNFDWQQERLIPVRNQFEVSVDSNTGEFVIRNF